MRAQINHRLLMEGLDTDCMASMGLVPDVESWRRKEVRVNTKINFTQNK